MFGPTDMHCRFFEQLKPISKAWNCFVSVNFFDGLIPNLGNNVRWYHESYAAPSNGPLYFIILLYHIIQLVLFVFGLHIQWLVAFLGERSEAFSHKDTSKWFRFFTIRDIPLRFIF